MQCRIEIVWQAMKNTKALEREEGQGRVASALKCRLFADYFFGVFS